MQNYLMKYSVLFILFVFLSCNISTDKKQSKSTDPYIFVLGIAQDAGYPQAGCDKPCCQRVFDNPTKGRNVVSLALIDPISNESWIFDATPDLPKQLKLLSTHLKQSQKLPKGIFLTHAHMGHYTGLMHLGREVMNAKGIQVYAMPQMKTFLETNGPWSQLVALENIKLQVLQNDTSIVLNERISVTPIQVPHRDEYSETVGFIITSKSKNVLFIPDIDKWQKWDRDVIDYIEKVDIAFLDATFYEDGEIKGRAMSDIPHPFVTESMALFTNLSSEDKSKIHFIHFNHTNPLLIDGSEAQKNVLDNGFKIAKQGMVVTF